MNNQDEITILEPIPEPDENGFWYTIYRITNNADGKIYIGKHKTSDLYDGYMGSGTILREVQAQHGMQNFKKEILHFLQDETQMNAKEAELVNGEFI